MTGSGSLRSVRYAVVLLLLAVAGLGGCKRAPTPTLAPRPSPVPTATPSLDLVLEGALFTLSVDGAMIATEEIHVGQSEGQLLVFSELHRIAAYPITERRTVALTRALDPLRYDLEVSALGVRSVWSGEVREKVIDCLNNNLAWYAPVLVEGISPAPQVMLEGSPSALPFALLALRYAQPAEGTAATPTLLRALDTLEDLPVSRALTLTVDPDRKGAVIGTLALEGQVEGGLNPRFTLWVRPGSRTLYSVEIPECRVNLWQQAGQPGLGRPGRLVIQRVSQLPEAPKPPAAGEAKRVPVEFTGADKTVRSGTLILPEGSGPFPVIVLHSAGGAVPRWDPGDAFAKRGWAVYCYDKRGLGASKGEYDRGALRALADDAALAAAMLRTRPEVDPRRIVFLGIGEGGQVGALAASLASDYAVAVLASCASVGPLFPDLAEQRILHVLAPFYGWTPAQAEAYRGLSVSRWKKWLADGKPEVALLRRRASVRPLKEWAETDLAVALGSAKVPVLLLHGGKDAWTPVDGARKLQEALAGAGAARVSLRVFDELGTDLGAGTSGAALGPEAEQATFEWLERTLVR